MKTHQDDAVLTDTCITKKMRGADLKISTQDCKTSGRGKKGESLMPYKCWG